jgi:PAS domain-containing protein
MTHPPFSTDAVIESLDSLGESFFAFDRSWRYIYLNRRAEQMLGTKT